MSKSISKEALSSLQKTVGKANISTLGENVNSDIARRPTGSISLDYVTGGGFPVGKIVELYGPESSGKTSTTIHAIIEEQRAGGVAAIIDAEHAFDKRYASKLGVDVDNLIISQPDTGEEALNITKALIETEEVGLIVIDSTNALVPKAELEGDVDDPSMALQARMLSKGLRMLKGAANTHNCTLIFISQTRSKIGPYGGQAVGVGNAMKFYASIRINIKKSQPLMDGGIAIGHTLQFEAKKNKTATPYRVGETFLRYGHGYDRVGELLEYGVQLGIIDKKGSWYAYAGSNLAQGAEKSVALLKDNPELLEEIEKQVIEGLKNQD